MSVISAPPKETMNDRELLTSSVIRVGEGRGLVIETYSGDRMIVTASHCLPWRAEWWEDFSEPRIFPDLLAPIGSEPNIWAECLFINPIADLAILGEVDN